jgi:hypothetical protein
MGRIPVEYNVFSGALAASSTVDYDVDGSSAGADFSLSVGDTGSPSRCAPTVNAPTLVIGKKKDNYHTNGVAYPVSALMVRQSGAAAWTDCGISVLIRNVNDAPVARASSSTIDGAAGTTTLDLSAFMTDIDSTGGFSFVLGSLPRNGGKLYDSASVEITTAPWSLPDSRVILSPAASTPAEKFSWFVRDGRVRSASVVAAFQINQGPRIRSGFTTKTFTAGNYGLPINMTGYAVDANSTDLLTYTLSSLSAGSLSTTTTEGSWTYMPPATFEAGRVATLRWFATDDSGYSGHNSSLGTIRIALNKPPLPTDMPAQVTVGSSANIELTTSDPEGDAVTLCEMTDSTGAGWSSSLDSTNTASIAVNSTGNGCTLRYHATATRKHGPERLIHWRAGDAFGKSSLSGRARILVVPGAVDSLALRVRIPYATTLVADGSTSTQLEATARDSFGNTVPHAAVSLTIPPSGGSSTSPNPGATDKQGRVSFQIMSSTVAGSKSYTVTSSGKTASTNLIFTAGVASAATSLVSVSSGSVAKGASIDLVLTTTDAYGNSLTSGGATVVFTQTGGTSSGTIGATTDIGNGTYTATFTGVTAGTATSIGATIGGSPLTSALPTVTVISPQASLEVGLDTLTSSACGCSGSGCPTGMTSISCDNLSFAAGTGYTVGTSTGSNGCNTGNTNCRAGYIEFEFTPSQAEALGLAAGMEPVAISLDGTNHDLNLLTQSELETVAAASLSSEWEKASTLSYSGNGVFSISTAASNYVQQDFPIVPNETFTLQFETDTSALSNRALEVRMKYGSSASTFCYLAYPSGTVSATSYPVAGGASGGSKYERVVMLPDSDESSGKFSFVYATASNGTASGDYASSSDVGRWTVLDQATNGLTFTRVEAGTSGCTPTTSTPYSELVFVTSSAATGSFALKKAKAFWNRDVETEIYDGSSLVYRSPDAHFVPENLPTGSSNNTKVRVYLRSLASGSSPTLGGISFLMSGESAIAKSLTLVAPSGNAANLAALGSSDRLGTDINWAPLSQKRNTTSSAHFTTNCLEYEVGSSGYAAGPANSCWQMLANHGLSRVRAYFPLDSWDLDLKTWATGSTKYFMPYLQQAMSFLNSDPLLLLSIHGVGSNVWSGVTSSASTSDGTNPSCTLVNTATYRGCSGEANEQAKAWCEINAMMTGCVSSSACSTPSTATNSIAKLIKDNLSQSPIFEVFNEINIVDGTTDRGSVSDPYCSCDATLTSCAGEGALASNYPQGSATSLAEDGVTQLMDEVAGSIRSNGYVSSASGLASEGRIIDSDYYSLMDRTLAPANFDYINFHPYVDANAPEKVMDQWDDFYASFGSTWGARKLVFGEYKVPRFTFDSSVSTSAYDIGFGELAQAKRLARQVIPMLVTPAEAIVYFYHGSNEDESYLGSSWDTQEAGGPATLWERSDVTTNPSLTSLMSGHTADTAFSIEMRPLLGGKVLMAIGDYLSRARPLGYVAERTDASGECVATNCETYFAAAFQVGSDVVLALWFVPPYEFGGADFIAGATTRTYYQNYFYGYDDGVDSMVHRSVGTNWDQSMRMGSDGVTYESVREVGFTGKRLHDFSVTLPSSVGAPSGSSSGVAETVDLETGKTRGVSYTLGSSGGATVFNLSNIVVGEMPTLVKIQGVSF